MTPLPDDRVGPYIRALRAGLRALAPGTDHPPAGGLDRHLHALDPAVSGPLLLPAHVDPTSGLPGLSWLDRVRAERAAAAETRVPGPERVAAIRRADPELAARLDGRRALLAHLGDHPLLPALAAGAQLVRRGPGRRTVGRVRVLLDRSLPGVGWVRVRVDVDAPTVGGRVVAAVGPGGTVRLQPGFSDLLARHAVSPLPGLYGILTEVAGLRVHRLSRGGIGPFWFPGGPLGPPWSAGALVLHLWTEVMGAEVRTPAHHDPLVGAVAEPPPDGYRGRRLAVSAPHLSAARRWCEAQVGVADVVPLVP